ncbi:MAG: GNAT family N-acetyltransferase [Magnetococcus sp. WYHC-3]
MVHTIQHDTPNPWHLQDDAWLGQVLNRPCYNLVSPEGDKSVALLARRLEVLPDQAFVTAKLPCESLNTLDGLQKLGFSLVDTLVTFEAPWPCCGAVTPLPPGVRLRPARGDDSLAVQQIAVASLANSRFYADPKLGAEQGATVQRAWAANFFRGGRGDHMVVAEFEGTAVGFNLLLARSPRMVIDLIAVDQAWQGQGLGQALIQWCEINLSGFDRWSITTQLANRQAVRFYERLGGRLVGALHVLHWHRPEKTSG